MYGNLFVLGSNPTEQRHLLSEIQALGSRLTSFPPLNIVLIDTHNIIIIVIIIKFNTVAP